MIKILNKKLLISIGTIIFILLTIVIIKNINKNQFLVNNSNRQDLVSQIQKKLIDLNSYSAKINITVFSNKNSNSYDVDITYNKPNTYVIATDSFTVVYDGTNSTLDSNDLEYSKTFDNFSEMVPSKYTLNSFLKNYITFENATYKVDEKNNELIFTTEIKEGNRYLNSEELHVNLASSLPKRHVIYDVNQKIMVDILYNEINFNSN